VTIGEWTTKEGFAFDTLVRETRRGETRELRGRDAPNRRLTATMMHLPFPARPHREDPRTGQPLAAGLSPRTQPMKRRGSAGSRTHLPGGFSLIEICLALGIATFALVAMMALLPIGLETFSRASDTTVHAQIAQRLLNTAQQMSFSRLDDLPADWFFDVEGFSVAEKDAVYFARVEWVPAGTDVPADPATITNAKVRTAKVSITKNRKLAAGAGKPDLTGVAQLSFFVGDSGL